MGRLHFFIGVFSLLITCSCSKDKASVSDSECSFIDEILSMEQRNFKMGFSTVYSDLDSEGRKMHYQFIRENGDIYQESFGLNIPWKALENQSQLPNWFTEDVDFRAEQKPEELEAVLTVKLYQNGLLKDTDDYFPEYEHLYDQVVEEAFFEYLKYLVEKINPKYLIIANAHITLQIWEEYVILMQNIKPRLKSIFPHLLISEHEWRPKSDLIADINYVNQLDFASLRYFAQNIDNTADVERIKFQEDLFAMSEGITIPIVMFETGAHPYIDPEQTTFTYTGCVQKQYLEALSLCAQQDNYLFIIYSLKQDIINPMPLWISDLDELWWSTGLYDRDGNPRDGLKVWKQVLEN